MMNRKAKIAEPLKDQADNPNTLRRKAEKRLKEKKEGFTDGEGRAPEKIIHELEVHQIELEMQNEALRETHLALEESRNKYIDLYDFAPVGYLTLSKNAIIEEGNLTCAALLGVNRQNLINDRFRRFVAKEDLKNWDRHFISVLRSADKQTSDLKLIKKDGSRFYARVESMRIDREKKDPVIRIAISDVTDNKRAEDELIKSSIRVQETNAELTTAGDKLRENEMKLTAAGNELRRNEARLTESLAEKEILLSEVHHRVKNNLTAFISLLGLDSSHEDTEWGRALRKDLQNRARSMALIHETLYRTGKFSKVDMDIYLTTLVGQVADSYGGSAAIRPEVSARGVILDLARASTAGLIINELVTNSFKYAFPPDFDCMAVRKEPCTIRVSLACDSGRYVLTVADNGRGLPPELDVPAAKSLGLKLVNFLARHQLRAEIEVRTDKGTEFIFHLKNKDEYS